MCNLDPEECFDLRMVVISLFQLSPAYDAVFKTVPRRFMDKPTNITWYGINMMYHALLLFLLISVWLMCRKLLFISNTAIWPENHLTGRVKVLHGHRKILQSLHRCRLTIGRFSNPFPLPANWFVMTLNVADAPHEHANGVKWGGRGWRGSFGKGPIFSGKHTSVTCQVVMGP